jgi:hypothetical protein
MFITDTKTTAAWLWEGATQTDLAAYARGLKDLLTQEGLAAGVSGCDLRIIESVVHERILWESTAALTKVEDTADTYLASAKARVREGLLRARAHG